MIWTGDHLDVVRRLQAAITSPARATAAQHPAAGSGNLVAAGFVDTPPAASLLWLGH